jgi:hypothetical protein
MTQSTQIEELAYRAGSGISVALLWSRADGHLTVVVDDVVADQRFEVAARADNALDVFYHPYAYSSSARCSGLTASASPNVEAVGT